ncbi:hypothetical protein [Bacillus ndiopicus]|uniref:hypothetical protein n=1 Tax=Bacillus ndiopicus TaxID=1347368 RepID=UPI000B1354F9|nr:hypothetical protein [Bacillus ndiopicus]
MQELMIVLGSLGLLVSIPLVAIVTAHKRAAMKLQIKMIEKETELEKLKMENYTFETERLRLELEQEKQVLLDMKR